VRGDKGEGISVFCPDDGLFINNLTREETYKLTGYAFESEVNTDEIFVFCTSRSFSGELRDKFEAVSCVEIIDIKTFCNKVEAALPRGVTFPKIQGRNRIGHRVEYYKATAAGSPRWALPDMIATSKADRYAWQDEFRLVFSFTNALGFQKVNTCLRKSDVLQRKDSSLPPPHLLKVGSLNDICRLHDF